jgi:hypothetical protein
MSADRTSDHLPTVTIPPGKNNPFDRSTSPARSEHLSALVDAAPKFKSGQIQGLWPQITDALAGGHKLKQIWESMSRDGLDVSYSRFRHVVAYLKRSHPIDDKSRPRPDRRTQRSIDPESPDFDPARNLRERLNKRPGFQFDERPPDLKKLV